MTPTEFADVLWITVIESASDGEMSNLRQPPGRRPGPQLIETSAWFNSLDADGQAMVDRIVEESCIATAFGVCALLDGVRTLDDAHGSLRLSYVGPDGAENIINDHAEGDLHDLLLPPGRRSRAAPDQPSRVVDGSAHIEQSGPMSELSAEASAGWRRP